MQTHKLTSKFAATHAAHADGSLYLKFPNSAYRYPDPGATHFENIRTAKDRKEPIGAEQPGSEGSYIIHHVVGLKGQPAPLPFTKLSPDEADKIFPKEGK